MKNINDEEKFFYSPSPKIPNPINVWFCFPAEYVVGMSSLGFLNLFRLFDETPYANIERIFLDTKKTSISIQNVNLISFSFSFEFDFINIFKILEKYKIPLFASTRNKDTPLIMGGGAVLTANPEPFHDIFDFIIVGDGEDIIPKIAKLLYDSHDLSKNSKLEKLAKIKGIYVPSIQNFSEIKRISYLSKECISSPIVTTNTTFSDTFLVEISRGCPYKCNFCLTSHINTPIHHATFESITKQIDIGLQKCNNIGLLGALVPANPCFENLCEYLLKKREKKDFKVSIGSLRADFITDLNIKMLRECGQKNATIAIEAGSQKMRDFINKKLTEDQIIQAAETCFRGGMDGLKIYAMIGLPNETLEDIEALIHLLKKIRNGKKLTLSINSFVPKKFTPFEKFPMENRKSLEKKLNYIKKECHKLGINFRPCSIAWNEIQGIISIANRSLLPYIYQGYYDGYTLGAFRKALKKYN